MVGRRGLKGSSRRSVREVGGGGVLCCIVGRFTRPVHRCFLKRYEDAKGSEG